MKDYYKILEVEENSSEEDIKKSFRNLSKKYHPDMNPMGSEKFKEIAEAYEIIGDKSKRSQYDNQRKNPYNGTPFETMFSQMFGGAQPNFNPRRKSAPDKVIKIQINPIESYLGSEKTIRYLKNNHCSYCMGGGGDQQTCTTCNGTGFLIKTIGTGFMFQQIRTSCSSCAGKGFTLLRKCLQCDGHGVKSEPNEIRINIPVGSDNGQFLKIPNLGDFRNGDYGDLVIQVEMIAENNFEKINEDLVYNLFLNLEEIQSDKFKIPHPDGELMISTPKVFDTSKPLRVKGKGFNGGDFYVKLFVKFEKTT
jgi:molecular chaperone DnaJ